MMRRLILGSQSPRRRELLGGLGVAFDTVTIDADESYPADLQAEQIPLYIARAKARAYAHKLGAEDLLITADTLVWCEGQVLGKPHDEQDARRMLRLLSGRTHQVFTAVVLTAGDGAGEQSFVDTTDVTFRVLTDSEIEYYIRTCRPFDKAGAYGIQEWIGYVGVTGIRGSYFNVMGLPLEPLYRALQERMTEEGE